MFLQQALREAISKLRDLNFSVTKLASQHASTGTDTGADQRIMVSHLKEEVKELYRMLNLEHHRNINMTKDVLAQLKLKLAETETEEAEVELELRSEPSLDKGRLSAVLETINEFDQIMETVVRSLGGRLQRSSGCFYCTHDRLRAHLKSNQRPKHSSCSHDRREQERILKLVEDGGNFRDFEDLVLKENEDSKIFLDGALRITRTFYQGEFKFRGRISRCSDFYDIAEKYKEKMVGH